MRKWLTSWTGGTDQPDSESNPELADKRQQLDELEFLYHVAPVGMCLVDRQLRYLRINQALADINGHGVAEHLGKTLAEMIPNLSPVVTPLFEQVFRSGEPITDIEVDGRTAACPDERCWVVSYHPLTDDRGQVWAVSSIVQDITVRKQYELKLQNANHRIENILESISGGFVSLDADWRFRYVNRAASEMLGRPAEVMLGQAAWEYFPAKQGSLFREKCVQAQTTGKRVEFETYCEATGASLECHCYPADDGLSLFFSDNTQTKKTLQRLRRSESESHRLAAVVEQCNDFVGICTPQGEPIYFNQAGREMLGLEPDEDISGMHFLKFFASEDHVLMTSVGIPALKKEGRWTGAVHLKNVRTGKLIPTLWNVFVIEDPAGELPEVWATVSPDLTEQRRLEQVLRESEQRALQANVAKSEFLANMSHEIRTPMSAILGYAEVLLECLKDPEDLNSAVVIKRNGEHLLELINDILDLSRIEAGKLEVDLQTCDLPELIADVAALMQVRAQEKQLDFFVHCDGPVPKTLYTDPTRVRQVLINLLGNAIKFTERGRVECIARYLPSTGEQSTLEFEVIDTGIGMNHEQQTRLFQPFCQGDNTVTRAFGGSGLGLAISKRLIEMLNGVIVMESAPGKGSRFRVRIPVDLHESFLLVEPQLLEPPGSPTSVAKPSRRLDCRVLVVDDRRDVRYISQHFLQAAGASVTTADDGEQALAIVYQAIRDGEPFDVIVMDMQMPNVDGYQAAAELRASGVEQPIIALTADAMKGDRERCLDAGCDDYLSKPIRQASFIELIANYAQDVTLEQLRQRRSRRRAACQEALTATPQPRSDPGEH